MSGKSLDIIALFRNVVPGAQPQQLHDQRLVAGSRHHYDGQWRALFG